MSRTGSSKMTANAGNLGIIRLGGSGLDVLCPASLRRDTTRVMGSFRMFMALLLVTALLSGCTAQPPSEAGVWVGTVGDGEVTARIGSLVVVFPAGVAPSGTQASVRLAPQSTTPAPDLPEEVRAYSESVSIGLEDGRQPALPISITLPVTAPTGSTLSERHLLFVGAVSGDGSQSYFPGTLHAGVATFTASVDHLSDFKVWGIDLGGLLEEAKKAFTQGTGLELPSPDCVGRKAVVDGTTFTVDSDTKRAFVCVEARHGLVVTAYPGTAMPYRVRISPTTGGSTAPSEVSLGTAGLIAVAQALRILGPKNTLGVFPGATATYTFKDTPGSTVWIQFDQEPVLLLLGILAKVLDVVVPIGKLERLQCLAEVADTTKALDKGLDGVGVGRFVRAFFSCASTVAELSPLGSIVIASLASGPAFLVTSLIGIVNELSGKSNFFIKIKAVAPPDVTLETLKTAEVPAACEMPRQRLRGNKTAPIPNSGANGYISLDQPKPEFADVARLGYRQAVSDYVCSLGGVGWPPIVILTGKNGQLLGHVDLTELTSRADGDRGLVESFQISGDTVDVRWTSTSGCCMSLTHHSTRLRWNGSALTVVRDDVSR